MNSIHVLLQHSIDYAGLFPPAGLGMQAAVENCLQYRTGPDAWALGRFILPATRLTEFERAVDRPGAAEAGQPWVLSILAGPNIAADLEQITRFAHSSNHRVADATVTAVEVKADSPEVMTEVMRGAPEGIQVFFELPQEGGIAKLVLT